MSHQHALENELQQSQKSYLGDQFNPAEMEYPAGWDLKGHWSLQSLLSFLVKERLR